VGSGGGRRDGLELLLMSPFDVDDFRSVNARALSDITCSARHSGSAADRLSTTTTLSRYISGHKLRGVMLDPPWAWTLSTISHACRDSSLQQITPALQLTTFIHVSPLPAREYRRHPIDPRLGRPSGTSVHPRHRSERGVLLCLGTVCLPLLLLSS
jgi:hypothetical protein